jgi:hypothetical protein
MADLEFHVPGRYRRPRRRSAPPNMRARREPPHASPGTPLAARWRSGRFT